MDVEATLPAGPRWLQQAVAAVRAGTPVAIVGDEERELGSGDVGFLMIAADHANEATINELTRLGRGMVYLCLAPERCEALDLRPTTHDASVWQRKLMWSIDAVDRAGIGISAADRAHTIAVAMRDRAEPRDLVSPGHVFPLRAEAAGTLARAGPTEAAVDLATLAGRRPGAVICEALDENGTIAGLPALRELCARHRLPLVGIRAIAAHRWRTEDVITQEVTTRLPLPWGDFTAVGFRERVSGDHHLALVRGNVDRGAAVLVSVHRECKLGLVFRANRCDCRRRLDAALRRIGDDGGIVIYLTRPNASDGHSRALASCGRCEAEPGAPPSIGPPSWSDADLAGAMLRALGVPRPRFLRPARIS